MTREEAAYDRGVRDARKGRAPLFRVNRHGDFVPCLDDPLSDEWDVTDRRAYLEGYDQG